MIIRFTVYGAPKLQPDVIRNVKNRARLRREWRGAVVEAARLAGHMPGTAPLKRAAVSFDCYRSGNEPDPDNLRISCKSLLDGLTPGRKFQRRGGWVVSIGCGLIAADTRHCIGTPEMHWHRCRNGDERVVITVRTVANREADEYTDNKAEKNTDESVGHV